MKNKERLEIIHMLLNNLIGEENPDNYEYDTLPEWVQTLIDARKVINDLLIGRIK